LSIKALIVSSIALKYEFIFVSLNCVDKSPLEFIVSKLSPGGKVGAG
jgi:hypothetical protein